MLLLHPIAQGEHRRQQRERGAVVGVAAGVGLGGEVLGHRHLRRQAAPALRVIVPAATSSASSFAGGGAKKFGATSTRETLAMTRFGVTMRPSASRVDAVRRDSGPAAASGRGTPTPRPGARRVAGSRSTMAVFQLRLVGAVDQVDAVGRSPSVALEAVDGLLDRGADQPGGPEEAEHARPAMASTSSTEPMPLAIAPAM